MNRITICIIVLMIFALPVFSSGEGISEITESAITAEKLPVTRVTLYTAGLAHMVHETTISGNEVIYFPVEPKDINDILKSLVVEDLDGGTVDVVNFDSSDPLNIVLSDLRVNPAGSPSIADFLVRTQGEYVVVTADNSTIEGRIFSVEKNQREDGPNVILNLLNNVGLSSVDITNLENLRFIDPVLQEELLTALGKIAGSRVKSVRTLKISFKGSGERRVRLSYIRAVPLWKTSYRIVLDKEGIPRLEGWAIVQNTGTSAWEAVQLGFVAGQPNAFTMDLASPKYITRQSVDTAAQAPIGPTSYGKASAPTPSVMRSQAFSEAPAMAMAEEMYDYEMKESYTSTPVSVQASGIRAGNFYRYDVKHPVTVDARSSAMIPIIQQENAGTSLGVYDPSYDLVFKGIRLKNDSEAQWAAGPATVLEGRYYGGDTLLPEMIPNSERLLTYAVHGSLEVDKIAETFPQRITALKIADGLLYRTDRMERETIYRVEGEEDELLIIHPREYGWNLTKSPDIAEETAEEYRFKLTNWEKPVSVTEEYIISNQFSLYNFQIQDFGIYLEWKQISDEMKQAFGKISEVKREVELIRTEINTLNSRLSRISRDQGRIRENMKVLDKVSDLFKRYSAQLEKQEEEITDLNKQIFNKQVEQQEAEKKLKDFITELDIG